MKKRIFLLVTCSILFILSMVFLGACNAHEHVESDWIVDKQATCVEKGRQHKKCTVCGDRLEWQDIEKSETHLASDWVVDLQPTCTSTGLKHTECMLCKVEIKSETINALEHEYLEGVCVGCGKAESDQTETHTHLSSNWITEVYATCSTTGVKYIECTDCHEKLKTEEIEKLPHTETDWIIDVDSTCTQLGKKHKQCEVCSEKIAEEDIDMKWHVQREYIYEEPTCESTTISYSICDVCENRYNEHEVYGYHTSNKGGAFERNETKRYESLYEYMDVMTWVYQPDSCLDERLGEVTFTCEKCNDVVSIYVEGAGEHKNYDRLNGYYSGDDERELDITLHCDNCYDAEAYHFRFPNNIIEDSWMYDCYQLYDQFSEYIEDIIVRQYDEIKDDKILGYYGWFKFDRDELVEQLIEIGLAPFHRALGAAKYNYGEDCLWLPIYDENRQIMVDDWGEEVYFSTDWLGFLLDDVAYIDGIDLQPLKERLEMHSYNMENFLYDLLHDAEIHDFEISELNCASENNLRISCQCGNEFVFTIKACNYKNNGTYYEPTCVEEAKDELECSGCKNTIFLETGGRKIHNNIQMLDENTAQISCDECGLQAINVSVNYDLHSQYLHENYQEIVFTNNDGEVVFYFDDVVEMSWLEYYKEDTQEMFYFTVFSCIKDGQEMLICLPYENTF